MRLTHIFVVTILLQSCFSFSEETRLELPSEEAQKQSSALVRDIFKSEYAKTAPADKAAFAKKLLQQAIETRDDASAKFVLFRETIDLAAQAGDAATVIQAVDAQVVVFKVDPPAALDNALDRVSGKVTTQDQRRAVVLGYIRVVELAGENNDFELAARSAVKAEAAARPAQDIPLLTRVQGILKETREATTEYRKIQAAQEKLKSAPDDADASVAMGRFYTLVKGDWETGLPLLAKGSDAALKELAEKEMGLTTTSDGASFSAAGDGWWAFGEKLSGTGKSSALKHAADLYTRALPNLSGLNKTRIEKRLTEFNSQPSAGGKGRREILQFADVGSAVKGIWKREGTDVISDRAQNARLMLPCILGESYDVKFDFTCTMAKETAILILHRNGKPFGFEVGSYGKYAGFTLIDGRGLDANPTATEVPGGYQVDKRYSVLVQVRKNKLASFLDGKPLVETSIPVDRINLDNRWALPSNTNLGIGGYGTVIRFHSIEVSGEVRITEPGRANISSAPTAKSIPLKKLLTADLVASYKWSQTDGHGTMTLLADGSVKTKVEAGTAGRGRGSWTFDEREQTLSVHWVGWPSTVHTQVRPGVFIGKHHTNSDITLEYINTTPKP